jgi:ABC-type spermidine/putrescine transport system permease subunit II
MKFVKELVELLGDAGAEQAVEAVIESLAVGLCCAQMAGLVGFPAGTLNIEEIESKLKTVVEATAKSLIERRQKLLG